MKSVWKTFGSKAKSQAWRVCVAAIASWWIICSSAPAQERAKDYLEPRLSRPQYALFIRQLGLDSDQRAIAELMFTDYSTSLDDLSNQLDEQARQAGLQAVQDVMAGKARLSADELRAKRVAVLKIYQGAFSQVDDVLQRLLDGLEAFLTDAQAAQYQPAVRDLRRELLLHPRQSGRDFQEYAGDGVDVLTLVDSAMKDGGELHGLDRAAIQNILSAYERDLDAYLVRSASRYRDNRMKRKIATIEKDNSALADLDQAILKDWKELFELNRAAVGQIGDIAGEHLGAAARQKWLDRFDEASFTWLYPRRKPDRQIEWIRLQNFGADLRDQAEAIYDGYTAKRRELAHQAIDIMLRGRLEFQTLVYSMMDPTSIESSDSNRKALYQELLKNSGEQATLDNTTVGALEGLLNSTQRDALRKAMQGPDPAARR
jgi:hypothetical protein